jgi:hypothetical protein
LGRFVNVLEMCTSQCTDQIAAKLTQAEGETLHFGIDRVTCSILNKKKLPPWQEFVTGPVFTTDIPLCI